jgi:hypothetical protein
MINKYLKLSVPYLSLIILTILGLYSKYYRGIGEQWINDYAGDILIEIFLCVLLFIILPKRFRQITRIVIIVFIFTIIIEFSQLLQTPFLDYLRQYFLGKLILGTTFSWLDFPCYILGCLLGGIWLKFLQRIAP